LLLKPHQVWKDTSQAKEVVREFSLNVSNGVNAEILLANLSNLLKSSGISGDHDLSRTKLGIQFFLWAWFFAMGASRKRVQRWLHLEGPQDQQLWEDLLPKATSKDLEFFTIYPLPFLIDVRLTLQTSYRLFGPTREDLIFSLQQLEPLCPSIYEKVGGFIFFDWDQATSGGRATRIEEIVTEATTFFANSVFPELLKASVPLRTYVTPSNHPTGRNAPISVHKYQKVVALCQPLSELLFHNLEVDRSSQGGYTAPPNSLNYWLETLLSSFLRKIKKLMLEQVQDKHRQILLSGLLHRAMVENLGFSSVPLNAQVHSLILKIFSALDMTVCKACFKTLHAYTVHVAMLKIEESLLDRCDPEPNPPTPSNIPYLFPVLDEIKNVDLEVLEKFSPAFDPIVRLIPRFEHLEEKASKPPFLDLHSVKKMTLEASLEHAQMLMKNQTPISPCSEPFNTYDFQTELDRTQQFAQKKKASSSQLKDLSLDEIGAIHLYTRATPLYSELNALLRNEQRKLLEPLLPYLKLLVGALGKLPTETRLLYRGLKNVIPKYQVGKDVTLWGFTSCTDTVEVLKKEVFFGYTGQRTLLHVINGKGVPISEFSAFPDEREILLLPGTTVKVEGILEIPPLVWIAYLK